MEKQEQAGGKAYKRHQAWQFGEGERKVGGIEMPEDGYVDYEPVMTDGGIQREIEVLGKLTSDLSGAVGELEEALAPVSVAPLREAKGEPGLDMVPPSAVSQVREALVARQEEVRLATERLRGLVERLDI